MLHGMGLNSPIGIPNFEFQYIMPRLVWIGRAIHQSHHKDKPHVEFQILHEYIELC